MQLKHAYLISDSHLIPLLRKTLILYFFISFSYDRGSQSPERIKQLAQDTQLESMEFEHKSI